jgi:hypothetical protein
MKPLALTLGAITTILLSALASAEDKNEYSNPTVGLSLTRPKGWQFATADEVAENFKRTKLSDEEFQKMLEKYSTAPLVAMMKHPEPFDDLNPSFKVNIKPLGGLPPNDPKKILSLVTKQFPKVFKDYKLVTAPTDTKISGLVAAYAKIHYSLEIPDGRSFPTCSELWIVPRGSYFFMIGAGTRQDESTGTRSEIRAILDSLKLVEPPGAGQPATKPADKAPAEVQIPTSTSKDSPR